MRRSHEVSKGQQTKMPRDGINMEETAVERRSFLFLHDGLVSPRVCAYAYIRACMYTCGCRRACVCACVQMCVPIGGLYESD